MAWRLARSNVDARPATWVRPLAICHPYPSHIRAKLFNRNPCGALNGRASVVWDLAAIEPVPDLLLPGAYP
jgi:hypothetical protein